MASTLLLPSVHQNCRLQWGTASTQETSADVGLLPAASPEPEITNATSREEQDVLRQISFCLLWILLKRSSSEGAVPNEAGNAQHGGNGDQLDPDGVVGVLASQNVSQSITQEGSSKTASGNS